MSRMVELNLHPDERILRQFGFIALGGFGLLSLAAWNEVVIFSSGLGSARGPVALSLAAVAALCALFSLAAPKLNQPIYLLLTIVAYPIGFVLSYVLMGTLFFLIIGPVGLVMRLVGTDPMQRRYDKSKLSYFSKVERPKDNERYFRQY